MQIDLRVVTEDSFGAGLCYFTGSKAHNIALRQIAADGGMKLNEYGLFKGTRRFAGRTEAELYHRLGVGTICLMPSCALDPVVGAIHYRFALTREKQTERLLRAIDNCLLSILAHPTGRPINERAPMPSTRRGSCAAPSSAAAIWS